MRQAEKDEERDERIEMEIIVDTYSADEQAMGWYAYLDDTMDFPFEARCITEREESPLEEGETVRVIGMSPTTRDWNVPDRTDAQPDVRDGGVDGQKTWRATGATGACRSQP